MRTHAGRGLEVLKEKIESKKGKTGIG